MDANGDGRIGSEDSTAETYEHATPRRKAYWWGRLKTAMKAAHKRDAIIEKARQAALRKIRLAEAARKRARGFHDFATAANGVLGCVVPVLFGLAPAVASPVAASVLGGVGLGLTAATGIIGASSAVEDRVEGGASWGQVALDFAQTGIAVAAELTGSSLATSVLGGASAAAQVGLALPLHDTPLIVIDNYVK